MSDPSEIVECIWERDPTLWTGRMRRPHGFGPRYPRSTGQLHKGGPPTERAHRVARIRLEDVECNWG